MIKCPIIRGRSLMEAFKIVACLLLICAASASLTKTNASTKESKYRLSASVLPTNYVIDLTFIGAVFSPVGSTFEGKTTIYFTLIDDAPELRFHASAAFIRLSSLVLNGTELTVEQYSLDSTTDIVTIPLEERGLLKGETYSLYVEYIGRISNADNYGIYKSTYTTSEGDVSYLLATQFEPTYARRAFPCFDEPAFKATFNVSITYYSGELLGLGVLFNTPPATTSKPDDYTTKVTFELTPKMSTYLLAFAISDFTSAKGSSALDGTEYAVWSRNELEASREYAVDVGPRILNALNAYTGKNYSTVMPKVDQVALPDFAAGAMENWGLVTYRERYLLWDKSNTVDTVKQSIATIIAHEFAHQWFGNLITCDWWSETFLNEGFARYFEYFITHEVEPAWQLDKQFVVNVLQPILISDSLENSQALKSEAFTPQEVSGKFGGITYNKGGSILRMLSVIIGEENYKQAIQEYVQDNELQFATATSTKLWSIFQNHLDAQYAAFPKDTSLANVMENWIEKPGYPLLTVSLNGRALTVSQERFLISGEDKESKWYIPINIVESQSEIKFQSALVSEWLTPSTPTKTVTLEYENSWVLLNTFERGYYRVNYEAKLWGTLATALQKEDFDGIVDVNRAQIVDDAFNIATARKLTYPEVFRVIEFLKHDTSYFPWVPAFTGFQYVLLRLPSNSLIKSKVQAHLLTLMAALYRTVSIGETKDDHLYTLTQSLASSWACLLGEQSCITESKRLFSASIQSGIKPHKNLRSVVYCNGLRHSQSASDYEYLWDLYGKTEESNEKLIILKALGCSTNSEKLQELLRETLKSDSTIRSQDAASVFAFVYSGSEKGVDVALDFLIENFKAVLQKYTSMSAQSTLINGIAARLTTEEQVNKLKEFIKANPEFEGDLKEVSEQALEQAQSNINWYSTHQADLEKYFVTDNESVPDGKDSANMAAINLLVLGVLNMILII